MPHNISLPRHLYVLVRRQFLYNMERGAGTFTPGVVHGVSSTPGRALGFHVLLKDGSRWSDLPIHALAWKMGAPEWPIDELELWDAFGYDISVTEYGYLKAMEVAVGTKTRGRVPGVYICSFDWVHNGFSEEPSQHKEVHLIALEDGQFALQPNNRCQFLDHSFVEPFKEAPDYKLNTHVWYSEFNFKIPDTDAAIYDVEETSE